ncbi:Nadh-ubiquinone oxidoreductase [Thalictrum thalictroides]|uniref:Nadh-ubiquinone oxidoreductase n=1 Tax=Thalictrum thalictroides TaxID=46969 RepID=A0A7J6W3I7_THATH|nr:Nadh-ubiquinone oxidoreductase [Thalictrum thalictroides]
MSYQDCKWARLCNSQKSELMFLKRFLIPITLLQQEVLDRDKMGFIMEFAENLILRIMENPAERDRKSRERVYAAKDQCKKTKDIWSLPIRPYGFWTFERHNSQLAWDAQISQVEGRRDPYDDLLEDRTKK